MPKYAEEILAAVTELQQHPKAEQVFLEMKREHPSIALGTVYLPPCREQEKTILWRRSIMNANVSLLLNEQINKEFYSAYLYLDFANYYAAVGLDGFENWYRVQAQDYDWESITRTFIAKLFSILLQNKRKTNCYNCCTS